MPYVITASVVAFLVSVSLLVSYAVYKKVFYSANKQQPNYRFVPPEEQYQTRKDNILAIIDKMLEYDYERVYITSRDGLRLSARYYEVRPGAPLALCFHGYRSTSVRDFCGASEMLHERGINMLMVDERAHDHSEGHRITFGIKERFDCLDWIEYARSRFGGDVKIVLIGVSMGASTVLMASGEQLPGNVVGTIADCGYSSPKEIILKVGEDGNIPSRLIYPFLLIAARLFAHINLNETDCIRALKNCKIPVLFIHGEDDRFVPCEMSRANYEACASEKELLTVPDAGHCLSYLLDTERYTATVNRFLDKIL